MFAFSVEPPATTDTILKIKKKELRRQRWLQKHPGQQLSSGRSPEQSSLEQLLELPEECRHRLQVGWDFFLSPSLSFSLHLIRTCMKLCCVCIYVSPIGINNYVAYSSPPLLPFLCFQLKLVAVNSDEFNLTKAESCAVYKKYQTTIHKEAEDKSTMESFERFLCSSPFKVGITSSQ